jgi:hypothetical protein
MLGLFTFIADWRLTEFSSRQENARLITELQIKREQAENDLRKDMFHQAIGTLLSEEELKDTALSLSKRMLKLELLALNFGGTLSLSPLFTEFDRDLEELERRARSDLDRHVRMKALRRRLRGLARRLASDQLSALEQHGPVFTIKAPLVAGGKEYASRVPSDFTWPDDEVLLDMGPPEPWGELYDSEFVRLKWQRNAVTLDGIERLVTVTLGPLDAERMTVAVSLEVCWNSKRAKLRSDCDEEGDQIVDRKFRLDFFNFPKIDNTRLSDNQRMGMILERFDTAKIGGMVEISAVIFPAEHSSLRDRPSMREAVKLLNSVLDDRDEQEQPIDEPPQA